MDTRYEIKMTDGEVIYTVYCRPDDLMQEIKDAIQDGCIQIQITKQVRINGGVNDGVDTDKEQQQE